jgi:hypothetical protein
VAHRWRFRNRGLVRSNLSLGDVIDEARGCDAPEPTRAGSNTISLRSTDERDAVYFALVRAVLEDMVAHFGGGAP